MPVAESVVLPLMIPRRTNMLKSTLIHPEISRVLAKAGHHAKILIADANYPAATKKGPSAEVIYLNLAPDMFSVAQVLEVVLTAHPVEEAIIMQPIDGDPAISGPDWIPPVWEEYRKVFAASDQDQEMRKVTKWEYYEEVITDDHILTIQTGETSMYANILLSTGVRKV
jgi:L-fucose mutarotase